MNPVLKQNLFFVKEHVGLFKAASNFDIYQPDTQEMIMTCREEKLGFFTKMLRFSEYKTMTPFDLIIRDMKGAQVVRVKRGVSWFRSKVQVLDENDMPIGLFRQRLLTIGGKFDVFDQNENLLCTLKGKWHGWDFTFADENREYGAVNKKWAGLGREMFTSADNYMLTIAPSLAENHALRPLILAAVMCIDFVLKERR